MNIISSNGFAAHRGFEAICSAIISIVWNLRIL